MQVAEKIGGTILKRLIIAFLAVLGAVLLATWYVPVCWKNGKITSEEGAILSALLFASSHPRINGSIRTADAAAAHLSENPSCCEILDGSDPFYSDGVLDGLFASQTRIAKVDLFSSSLGQVYSLFIWVDRCGKVVEFTGIEA